jgi:transcriptional regulator with XRE-family HTH domain
VSSTVGSRRRRHPIGRVDGIDDVFANQLRLCREIQGVSRRELSIRSGIPYHVIEKIETGHGNGVNPIRRRASVGEAIVLAESLGLTPGDLLKAPSTEMVKRYLPAPEPTPHRRPAKRRTR